MGSLKMKSQQRRGMALHHFQNQTTPVQTLISRNSKPSTDLAEMSKTPPLYPSPKLQTWQDRVTASAALPGVLVDPYLRLGRAAEGTGAATGARLWATARDVPTGAGAGASEAGGSALGATTLAFEQDLPREPHSPEFRNTP